MDGKHNANLFYVRMDTMHTPMRRKNLERREPEFIDDVLHRAEDIYIAFSAADAPYIVPLNFIYLDKKIYFHTALAGRKLECIKNNPKVGFSTAIDITIMPEEASTLYKSIIGTGSAHLVEDASEKGRVLDAIAKRYNASCDQPATQNMIAKTGIVCIQIESICGKGKDAPAPLSDFI